MIKELVLVQRSEDPDEGLESIVLIVHRHGGQPLEVQIPAGATGAAAARLVAQRLGIDPAVWPGISLVTMTGEKIPGTEQADRWDGCSVRLGVTHSSMMTGK